MFQEKDDHGKKEQVEKTQVEAADGEGQTWFGKTLGQEERREAKNAADEGQEKGQGESEESSQKSSAQESCAEAGHARRCEASDARRCESAPEAQAGADDAGAYVFAACDAG